MRQTLRKNIITKKNIKRWFGEKWTDNGHKNYSVQTNNKNNKTPLIGNEIEKKNSINQKKIKTNTNTKG